MSAEASRKQLEFMAHAMGWPDARMIQARKGVMRREWLRNMRNPYRNGFSVGDDNVMAWRDLVAKKLAVHGAEGIYHLTPAGQKVVRNHLLMTRLLARL